MKIKLEVMDSVDVELREGRVEHSLSSRVTPISLIRESPRLARIFENGRVSICGEGNIFINIECRFN